MQVTIGGEQQTLGTFSAYKAFAAMDIIANVEAVGRLVISEAATFKRTFEAENVVTISRAEARRRFPPEPLLETRREELEDGRVVIRHVPLINEADAPVMVDPLGHLTDADWEASGQVLTVPSSPTERMQIAAMVPTAFKHARAEVLRLMALATTTNRQLEEWDGEKDLHVELDRIARELEHRCTLAEIIDLASAVLALSKAEVQGPLARLAGQVQATFKTETPTTDEPEPMTVEHVESASDSSSSISSPDDSDGGPTSSSTEPASALPSTSPTG